jgi:integrase
MNDNEGVVTKLRIRRPPWNKGKLVGAKPPLRPSHVWSIRTKLQMASSKRDLALFNLAIDSKLRGCDVVAVRVDDVAPSGYAVDRATIRQKKTGRPVRFELTDQTRLAIDDYLRVTERKPGDFLFAGRAGKGGLTTRQYAASPTLGRQHRPRPGQIRHALASANQSRADLQANRQPQGCAAFARTFEDRKHGSLSRHRGR